MIVRESKGSSISVCVLLGMFSKMSCLSGCFSFFGWRAWKLGLMEFNQSPMAK